MPEEKLDSQNEEKEEAVLADKTEEQGITLEKSQSGYSKNKPLIIFN